MPNANHEQCNPYKGQPPQPWVKVRFEKVDGTGNVEKELAVDTGDPREARISSENMKIKWQMVRMFKQTSDLRRVAGSVSTCPRWDLKSESLSSRLTSW